MGSDTKKAASHILLSVTLVSDLLYLPEWEVKPSPVGTMEMTWDASKKIKTWDTNYAR